MAPPLRDKSDSWERLAPRHVFQSAIDTLQFSYCLFRAFKGLDEVQSGFLRYVQSPTAAREARPCVDMITRGTTGFRLKEREAT